METNKYIEKSDNKKRREKITLDKNLHSRFQLFFDFANLQLDRTF